MKIFNTRNIIVIIILTVSCFIFEMAVSALYPVNNRKVSDANDYCEWKIEVMGEKNPDIKTVLDQLQELKADKIVFYSSESQVKVAVFSKGFIEGLECNIYDYDGKNVAIVNDEYNELIYKKNNKDYVNYQGEPYLVVGTYNDKKDAKITESMFYIDADSPIISRYSGYDSIVLSFNNNVDYDRVSSMADNLFAKYSVTDNIEDEYISNRKMFASMVLVCALLVIFNCVGFIQKWIGYHKKELSVRRMVGATKWDNVKLLYKRFFLIFIFAYIVGTIISLCVLYIINMVKELESTRELFGTHLGVNAAVVGAFSVFVIGNLLLGVNTIKTGITEADR